MGFLALHTLFEVCASVRCALDKHEKNKYEQYARNQFEGNIRRQGCSQQSHCMEVRPYTTLCTEHTIKSFIIAFMHIIYCSTDIFLPLSSQYTHKSHDISLFCADCVLLVMFFFVWLPNDENSNIQIT